VCTHLDLDLDLDLERERESIHELESRKGGAEPSYSEAFYSAGSQNDGLDHSATTLLRKLTGS
jgi:hypothetical protein